MENFLRAFPVTLSLLPAKPLTCRICGQPTGATVPGPHPFSADCVNALRDRVATLEAENADLREQVAHFESRSPED